MNKLYIGIDIGGTKTSVVLGTGRCKILDKIKFPTQKEKGPDFTIDNIKKSIKEICKRSNINFESIKKIGISCGGPLNSKKGIILSPPNLPGWDNIPIKEIFEKEFKIPANLENDANAAALAEWKFGAGKGLRNLIFLTMGTGMGAGLILNGKLYSGTNDLAGEVGHIRLEKEGPIGYGKEGSFEGLCSGGGIAQLARKRIEEYKKNKIDSILFKVEPNSITAETVGKAALSKDTLALKIIEEVGYYLGLGLSILIDILNPEIIVIGGIAVRLGELILSPARKVVYEEALKLSSEVCKIVPAGLGENIGDVAALCVAIFKK